MTSKTELWDRLGKTDPKHTKGFKRAGGFSGTAIKPIYSYRRMTEEYGPCGVGWGVGEPSFQVVPGPEGEVLVYCTVSIWHGDRANLVFGVGGDKAVGKNKYGLSADDEAFKKAFTDAVTNALKLIGVGADVHMGLFEDNKYLAEVREEFTAQPAKRQNPHVTRPEDIFDGANDPDIAPQSIDVESLSKAKAKALFAELQAACWKCGSVEQLQAWNLANKPQFDLLPNDWFMMLKGVYAEHKAELIKLATRDNERLEANVR
jgi:hypothetical protein